VAEVRDERCRVDGGDVAMVRFVTASGMKTWAERGEACLQESIKLSDRCRTYFGIAEGRGDDYNRLLGGRHGLAPLVAPTCPHGTRYEAARLEALPEGQEQERASRPEFVRPAPPSDPRREVRERTLRPEYVRPAPPSDPRREDEERRNRDLRKREEERSRERKSARGKGVKGRWRK
jgi:hypothetical protein